jgi:hypothetical protein
LAVASLRVRFNERHDFVITGMPVVDESEVVASSELLFPHFADSGGYVTQFVLFGRHADRASSGTVYFFTPTGQPLALFFRAQP